jgi:uncharacterized repeat protein (TIGR01451 family)
LPLLTAAIAVALWSSARDAVTQSGAPSYGVTDLGTIGGTSTVALAVDSGAFPGVYGYGATASGDDHAFAGNASARPRDLGTLGGQRSEAHAASSARAVGRAQLSSGAYHAFFSDLPFQNPMMQDLGTLGGSQSSAKGIALTSAPQNSIKYLIVGESQTSGDAATRAFMYDTSTGMMSELGATLGGANSAATAISGTLHVVGYADLPGGQSHHAFLYANRVTQDLGSLGTTSEALAINDTDVIVGRSQLGNGAGQHAFRYQNGVIQDLGTLGGVSSEAVSVSSAGTIVGWSETAPGVRHAFLWRDGVMTDLNTLIPAGTGWMLQAATDIGNGTAGREAIVGYGQFQGQTRAFLLTPPNDISIALRPHSNNLDTNFPNPHEAGQLLTFGVTVHSNGPFTATGVVVSDTIGGPVEFVRWWGDAESCAADGLHITCRMRSVDFTRDVFFDVRATGAGTLTHSASISADQPDPNTANNSGSESNTAVSLATLELTKTTAVGGESVLSRTTLTSNAPHGGATVTLTSSDPAIASVPSPFDVLRGCCDDGMWREFYVTTKAVSAPVTVQISASYGLVTKTVPLTITPSAAPTPYGGSAWPIPGTIEAENFDEGGEGVAYHDTNAGNEGGAYRSTDVDIEATSDAGGGYNVGWMVAGEWLAYTVSVDQSRTYTLKARVAANGAGGTFHVEFGGIDKTGPLTIPDTQGWQAWADVSATVSLTAGVQSMRIVEDANGPTGVFGNINYLQLSAQSSGGGPTPFGGAAWPIPGAIQAEDFDDGGEGVAYHDTTAENIGGQYRTTGVDVQATTDAGGGFNVGWMTAGEWLNYTVSVAQSGSYTLVARVAAKGAGGTFHVEFGGIDKTGAVTIPNTGGWQGWVDVNATVSLTAGVQSMRIVEDANGPTGVIGNINYLQLSAQSTGNTVILSGGFLSFYLGDPGAGLLTGDGFSVDGTASGGWPGAFRPGDSVDFSTAAGLSNWGNATVNGTQLHGDPSGPGAGRLWISGSLHAVAKPFIAPPPSEFTSFSAPVTLSGTVSGYYNSDTSQSPLFTVNVVGHGIAGGTYRFIDNGGGDMLYLDNCCARITITAPPEP